MRKVLIEIQVNNGDKGTIVAGDEREKKSITLVLERPEELAEIIHIFTRNFPKCMITIGHQL